MKNSAVMRKKWERTRSSFKTSVTSRSTEATKLCSINLSKSPQESGAVSLTYVIDPSMSWADTTQLLKVWICHTEKKRPIGLKGKTTLLPSGYSTVHQISTRKSLMMTTRTIESSSNLSRRWRVHRFSLQVPLEFPLLILNTLRANQLRRSHRAGTGNLKLMSLKSLFKIKMRLRLLTLAAKSHRSSMLLQLKNDIYTSLLSRAFIYAKLHP